MKAERDKPKGLVSDEIGEGHQRPIIVRGALRALEGPDGAAEDAAEVSKAVDIGIFENLLPVVVDESVRQSIQVGQSREQNQKKNGERIAILACFFRQAISGHEVMVAERIGGI